MKKYAFLTAVLLLCFMGTAVADEIDGLMEQLSNGNPAERLTAAKELGGSKDPRGIGPLIKALKSDRNWDVRLAAEDALVSIGSPSVTPLIQMLKEEGNCFVRRRSARALKEIKDPRAVEALENAALKDADCCVRRFAAMALADINDPWAAEFLDNVMKNRNLEIISAAYPYYIRKGIPGTEDTLIDSLRKFSYLKKMVCDFVCCNNEKLKQAAEEIAKSQKYTTPSNWSGPSWGKI
jgi:HEAT repeat protein